MDVVGGYCGTAEGHEKNGNRCWERCREEAKTTAGNKNGVGGSEEAGGGEKEERGRRQRENLNYSAESCNTGATAQSADEEPRRRHQLFPTLQKDLHTERA